MPGTNSGKYLLPGNGAGRVRLHRIADANNFLTEPLLDCGITLLQCPQSGAHRFAARSIAPGSNTCIDITSLLSRQAETSLFR